MGWLNVAVVGSLLLLLVPLAFLGARRLVGRTLPRRVSGLPLAWFRIAYALVLLLEVHDTARLERLWADAVPYVSGGDASLAYALLAWRVALVCLALGLYTRPVALVNYVLTLATFSTFERFEYHLDYLLTAVNLLLVVTPVSARLSLDRLLESRRRLAAGLAPEEPPQVSELHGLLVLVFGIGVVYLDSVFYKLASPMWTGGLGVWLPASMPHVAWNDFGPLLDQEWAVKTLGYLTLVFEAVFLFLVWFRPLRPVLLAVGLGLHVGITSVFPIPWFGLAVVCMYALLVPPSWYEAAAALLRRRAPWLEGLHARLLRAPARGPLPAGDVAPRPDGVLPRGAWVALITVLVASQLLVTLQAPYVRELASRVGLGSVLGRARPFTMAYVTHVSRPLAGIIGHGVFMDVHFQGYEHIVSVAHVDAAGNETWLPLHDESGAPAPGNTGRMWVFWSWRVVGTEPDPERIADGVRRVTAFWAHEQGLALDDARFVVRVKQIEPPTQWAPGHLERERARPWRELARAHWREGRFWWEIADIGSL